MPGSAEADIRVVGVSAITVTEDRLSRCEPSTRTVSVAIATNTQAPTASEIVLSGWLKRPAVRCVFFIANKFRAAPVADDLVWPPGIPYLCVYPMRDGMLRISSTAFNVKPRGAHLIPLDSAARQRAGGFVSPRETSRPHRKATGPQRRCRGERSAKLD